MKNIPSPILDMLKQEWRPNGSYSAFESVIKERNRAYDPSFYHYRKDGDLNQVGLGGDGLKGGEVLALAKVSALEDLFIDNGKGIAVNEHAQHAIMDFCSEVYDAWRKCQSRLDSIPRKELVS